MKTPDRMITRLRKGLIFAACALSVRTMISLMILTSIVSACAWILVNDEESVRFSTLSEKDFSRLPGFPRLIDSVNNKAVSLERESFEYDFEIGRQKRQTRDEREKEITATWEEADSLESEGNLAELRPLLQKYLRLTQVSRDVVLHGENRQKQRNSATDRLDALAALGEGASARAVTAYLQARHTYDVSEPDEKIIEHINAVPPEQALRDNTAYLLAAVKYAHNDYDDAERRFRALASRFPRSEKREAALFMVGLIHLKRSPAFNEKAGRDFAAIITNEPPAATAAPDALKTDTASQEVSEAFNAFHKVIREYPQGRYTQDARGWLAFLHLHKEDRVGALVEYYRMLASSDLNAQVEAAFSLGMVRDKTTISEMSQVERVLAREPAVALTYAYHCIYNYSVNPGCPAFEEVPDWEERDQAAINNGIRELKRVTAFASRMMSRYPEISISGAFALRLAQANLESHAYQEALTLTRRALQSGLAAEEYQQALWTKGFAEHRTGNFVAAEKTIHSLLKNYPNSRHTAGARRLLALIAEDSGDLNQALEQYLLLNYEYDVAYIIDVLMTPDQLSEFIRKHSTIIPREKLLYALGVRMMRAGRWQEARAVYTQLRTAPCQVPCGNDNNTDEFKCWPKHATADQSGLCDSWVSRDLQTIDDLERLEGEIERAQDTEAKAEAMYQMASYQFQGSTLMFYNSEAWGNVRHYLLSEMNTRIPDESRILREYLHSHETPARALKIYLDVVRLFPQTRAARDSLYTAAVCHERLSDYFAYWRELYRNGLHAGERMVTYADVRRAYPDYQLPRGTICWEPMTRTVKGRPGFAPPPKPAPRLSREQKVLHVLQRFGQTGKESAGQKISRIRETLTQAAESFQRDVVHPLQAGTFWWAMISGFASAGFLIARRFRNRTSKSPIISLLHLNEPSDQALTASRVERIIND